MGLHPDTNKFHLVNFFGQDNMYSCEHNIIRTQVTKPYFDPNNYRINIVLHRKIQPVMIQERKETHLQS